MNKTLQLLLAVSFALPSFLMAFKLLQVWRAPMEVDEGRWVREAVTSTGLEFLHLLGTLLMLAFLYNTSAGPGFAVVAAALIHVPLVLATREFVGETRRDLARFVVVRGISLLIGGAAGAYDFLLLHTYISMFIYIPLMFLSMMLPVPRLGITDEVIEKFVDPKAVGEWEKRPHIGLFSGTVYFFLLGMGELFFLSRVDPTEFLKR